MTYTTLTLTSDQRDIATLTLARARQHNAMNATMLDELGQAVEQIRSDPCIRALVISGQGSSFCAGADLRWMQQNLARPLSERLAESNKLGTVLHAIEQLPQLVVAAVNGAAFGGGVGLICACDIAIGVESATFSLSEVRLGLAAANIAPYLLHRLGRATARRLLLNASVFDADAAKRYGLLDECVAAEALQARVQQEIQQLLRCAPQAVAASKRLIAYVATHDLADNQRYCAALLAELWQGEEAQEGIQAFLDKRKPRWDVE